MLPGKLKSRQLILKLFLSFIGTSILAVTLLAASISYWYGQKSMNYINNAIKLTLYNINSNLSAVLDASNSIAFEIYKTPSASALIRGGEKDFQTLIAISKHIDTLMLTNPWFLSAYIYAGDACVYKNSREVSFNEDDISVNDYLRNANVLKPVPRIIKNMDKTYHVFTIVYYETSYKDGAVIININADILYDSIYPIYMKNKEGIYIIDSNGNVLLHSNKSMFLQNLRGQSFIDTILDSKSLFGYLTTKIDKKKYMINYTQSSNHSFFTLAPSDFTEISSELSSISKIVAAFCLIIFSIILLISIYVFTTLYKPINNVFSNIKTFLIDRTQNYDFSKKNEIQYASDTILKTIERINDLESNKQENLTLQKEAFIRQLLVSDEQIKSEDITKSFEKHGIIYDPLIPFCVVVIKIDNFEIFKVINRKEAIDLQLFTVSNIAYETLRGLTHCMTFEIDSRHIALFIFHPDAMEKGFPSKLLFYLQNIKSAIQNTLKLSVTMGMSDSSDNIADIRNMYNHALEYTNYRLLYGKGSIINQSSLTTQDNKNLNFENYFENLISAVKNISIAHFEDSFSKLFEVCKHLSYENTLTTLSQAAQQILKIPSEIGIDQSSPLVSDYLNIYKHISSFEDYTETKEWFISIFANVSNMITNVNCKSSTDLVSEAIVFIRNSYTDPQISASLLAEKLSITPQYFSRIFKENTGTGFPEYLNNLRLENAKELILSFPELDIDKVCQKVGYNNKRYFSTLYKNKYGVLPSKLKQSL